VRIVAGEVEATVKALTSSIEPLMIVVVGGIVIAMYVPMFKIFELVK
jgi:type IV pilus assembly protein PilC